jgi:hypothetical protein
MTVPRLMHLDHDRLHQSPAPELLSLRRGEAWQCGHVALGPDASLPLPGVVGSACLDIEVHDGSTCSLAQLLGCCASAACCWGSASVTSPCDPRC